MRNFINYLSGVLDRREQLLQTHDRSSAQRRRRSTADVVPPAAMFLRSLLQFNERVMHLDQTQVPHLEDRMSQMHLRVQSTSQERARPISDPLTRPPGSRDLRLRQARALITQHREQSAAAKIRDLSGTQFIALNAQPDSLPDVSSEPCEQSKPLLVKDRHILKSGGNSTANVAFPSEETRPSDIIPQQQMQPSSSAAEQRENLAQLATTRIPSGSTSAGASDSGRDAAKATKASLSFSDQAHAKPYSPQEQLTTAPSFGSSQPDTAPRASLAFSLGALDSEISRTSTLAPVLSETSSAGSPGGLAATAAASPPAKTGAIAYSSPPVSAGTNAPATSTLDFGAAALKIQDAKSGVNTLSTKPKAALAAAAAPTLAPFGLASSGGTSAPPVPASSSAMKPFGLSTAAAPVATNSATAAGTSSVAAAGTGNVQAIREQVVQIYKQHNPTKVAEVDKLMVKYKGNEQVLLQKIQQKYGAAAVPQSSASAVAAVPPAAGATAGAASTASPFGLGSLSAAASSLTPQPFGLKPAAAVPTTQGTPSHASPFGVPAQPTFATPASAGTQPSPFNTPSSATPFGSAGATGAAAPATAASPFGNPFGAGPTAGAAAGSSPFGAKTPATPTAFGLAAGASTAFGSSLGHASSAGGAPFGATAPFGQAPAPGAFPSASVNSFPGSSSPFAGGGAAAQAAAGSAQGIREQIIQIYQQYNPLKVAEVDKLMLKYQGNEATLLQKIQQKYSGANPAMQSGAAPPFGGAAAMPAAAAPFGAAGLGNGHPSSFSSGPASFGAPSTLGGGGGFGAPSTLGGGGGGFGAPSTLGGGGSAALFGSPPAAAPGSGFGASSGMLAPAAAPTSSFGGASASGGFGNFAAAPASFGALTNQARWLFLACASRIRDFSSRALLWSQQQQPTNLFGGAAASGFGMQVSLRARAPANLAVFLLGLTMGPPPSQQASASFTQMRR